MNGIIIIDKPKNYTSRDIVNIASKKLNTKKIGHTGTLDPIATGVLVLCVGKALKISELLTSEDKEYIADLIIGYETDTLDITGIKTKEKKVNITIEQVKEVLSNYIGVIDQQVPKYSAIKVNGKKLYQYAREGIEVDLPIRKVNIKELKLTSDLKTKEGYIEFQIKCKVSKGTYIRSLIRDIGLSLGSYATMKELRRTKQGKFTLDNAVTIENIDKTKLIKITKVLDIPTVTVKEPTLKKIKNGCVMNKFFEKDMALILDENQNEIAIYKNQENKSKVYKMF